MKYVTFEQAKWLKEKGFDIECKYYYDLKLKELTFHVEDYWKNSEIENGYPKGVFEKLGKFPMISAPEQHQVVEWLIVNYSLWISCYPTSNPLKCQFRIYKNDNGVMGQVYDDYMGKEFNSPQEAYSAAFDYIKDNNII